MKKRRRKRKPRKMSATTPPDQMPTEQAPTPPEPTVAYFGFTGLIDSSSVTRICSALNGAVNEGYTDVYLAFSSLGGYTADGIYLYNTMRGLPINITMHATGNIASVAVAIFLGADYRLCSRHVLLMMHPVAVPSSAEGMAWERLQGLMSSALAEEQRTENILRERASIPDELLAQRRYRDVHITPEDAVKFRIAHSLGEFGIPPGAQIFQI
jgi:ATP-dependent Clp protease, protease subunit